MMMIVKLELGEQKRKVMVEVTTEGEVVVNYWLVGYIPNGDDAERLKIEFDMMGVIKFTEYADADTAFDNYSI